MVRSYHSGIPLSLTLCVRKTRGYVRAAHGRPTLQMMAGYAHPGLLPGLRARQRDEVGAAAACFRYAHHEARGPSARAWPTSCPPRCARRGAWPEWRRRAVPAAGGAHRRRSAHAHRQPGLYAMAQQDPAPIELSDNTCRMTNPDYWIRNNTELFQDQTQYMFTKVDFDAPKTKINTFNPLEYTPNNPNNKYLSDPNIDYTLFTEGDIVQVVQDGLYSTTEGVGHGCRQRAPVQVLLSASR